MAWFHRLRSRIRAHRMRRAEAKDARRQGAQAIEDGDFDRAIELLRASVRLAPDVEKAHFLLGRALHLSGDSAAAITPLRRCLSMYSHHAKAHLVLSMALTETGDAREAEKHCAKAAYIGDRRAQQLLWENGGDYCRRCGRPLRFAGEGTDRLRYLPIDIGLVCEHCEWVQCVGCADSYLSATRPGTVYCEHCGSLLAYLTPRSGR